MVELSRAGDSVIEEVDFLDPGGIEDVVAGVDELGAEWTTRSPSPIGVLHTLGAATYLDTGSGRTVDHYRHEAARLNPILGARFAGMYARLCQVVESATGIPAFLTGVDGLPGFHIFDPFTYDRENVKPPHHDTHVLRRLADVEPGTLESMACLTVTAILVAPPSGASIDFWDIDYDDKRRSHSGYRGMLNAASRGRLWRSQQRRATCWNHRYTIGSILIVRGLPNHRIAPLAAGAQPGRRISLQGHGTLTPDGWELFW